MGGENRPLHAPLLTLGLAVALRTHTFLAQAGLVAPVRQSYRVSARRGGRLLPLLSVALVFVFLAPYGMGVLSQASAARPSLEPAQTGSVTGQAFWNGVNVDTAGTTASALSWSFNTIATVTYQWTGPASGTGVSQAFLVILFLGFPAYTKQEVQSAPSPPSGGSISMTYDLTQFKWYLQGVYELHAYLENPAGNTLWSEDFYVKVAQPYDLVVATVGLLLLTLAELYLIATVGPRAMDRARKTPPPSQPEPEESPSGSSGGGPSSTPPEKS
jgi:hypothetical protein